MPRIAPSLLHLVASALLALILSLGLAEAGIDSPCPGGSDIAGPGAPVPDCSRGL